jgi:hypothetical protein
MLKKILKNDLQETNNYNDDCFYMETDTEFNPDIILSFKNTTLSSPLIFNEIFNVLNDDYSSIDTVIDSDKIYNKLKYNIVLQDLLNKKLIKKLYNIEYIKNKSIYNFVIKELKDRRKMKEYKLGYTVWKSLLGDKEEF